MSRRHPSRQPPKLSTKPVDTEPAQPPNRPSEAIDRVAERVSITQSFQGPLPPPGLPANYNIATLRADRMAQVAGALRFALDV